MATIQGVYIALFGRPADPLGLAYFNQQTNNGANLAAIGNLAGTAEYTDRFTGLNNTQIVNSIYQSLFGRDADLAGLTFFVNALTAKTLTINNIAIAILDGAQGDDKTIVTNKLTAANAFTTALDTGTEVASYSGASAAAAGVAFLSGVGVATTTIPTAAQTDAAILNIVKGTNPGVVGEIFTLTDALNTTTQGFDVVKGTANDDTIRGLSADSLVAADIIHGGGGNDVLNLSVGAFSGTIAPIIDGVETINSAVTGATLDLSNVVDVQKINSTGAAATYTNATTDIVFGAGAAGAAALNIDYKGTLAGETTVLLESTLAAGATTTVDYGADAANIEHVSLNAASGSGTVVLDADLDALTSITVTGAGKVTVTSTEATLTTFDASANTGGVSYTSGAIAGVATVTGGSGNDTFNFAAATATSTLTIKSGAGSDIITGGSGADTIDAGAGNDIINGSAGKDMITLGAGNDVVIYGAGAVSTIASINTILDFQAGDSLSLSAVGGAGVNYRATAVEQIAVQNAVDGLSAGSTLTQATTAAFAQAAGAATNDVLVTFQFGGDTYVAVDVGNNNTYDAGTDFVVKLTGLVDLNTTNVVF